MPTKVPATVITGFLGAGKTTLIRHLLENANGKRIALIINEFGDLGVDGQILAGCGIENCDPGDMIELSNGCICCTVADDFIPAMTQLLDRADPPDHIVIETSGLAIPQPLVRAFTWPDIRTRVTVDGVVTVVDGKALAEGRFAWDEAALDAQRAADEALDHDVPVAELFEDQLACADLVLVNKADLLTETETASPRRHPQGPAPPRRHLAARLARPPPPRNPPRHEPRRRKRPPRPLRNPPPARRRRRSPTSMTTSRASPSPCPNSPTPRPSPGASPRPSPPTTSSA